MSATETTLRYFELSNERDLEAIFALFTEEATYSSDNTGLFYGLPAIRAMVVEFFDRFPYLHWQVHSIRETKACIAEVDFTLTAHDQDGQVLTRPGIERVVVVDGRIRHVEVRNT